MFPSARIGLHGWSTDGASSQAYNFTDKGITWKNEYKKYTNKPPGEPSDYLPPPNWAARYPDGYTEFPQLASDEHFQVWMKISALPTFTKLWGRNDNEVMQAGTYQVVANMSEFCQFGGDSNAAHSGGSPVQIIPFECLTVPSQS